MKYLLSFALILLFSFNSQAATEVFRIATCDSSGNLTVDLITEGPDRTPIAIKYKSYMVLYNKYTDKMDVYEKRGEAKIDEIEVNDGATSFKVTGKELDRTMNNSEYFDLKALNLIENREIYILRKNAGNKWLTIHPRCEYSNTSLYR
jgi:hypothetical protein